jgi:LEA14-like dessication related protein
MLLATAVLALAAPLLASCTKPELPTVKPVSGKLTGINTTGIEVEAKLEAYNPNDFDIEVRGYTATMVLDHKINVGTITSQQKVTLPAKKKTTFDVPVNVKWNDATQLAPLALSTRDVPWDAEGKVKIGGDMIDVELPFKVNGTLTHQQIVQAVNRSLPKIPGLPGLPF